MDEAVRRDIETAARILKEAGADEVYAFGSAITDSVRPESDIDLAVRGLPPEVFFRAMGTLLLALSRSVDLVDLDEENPFTEYLVQEGELLRVA